MPRYLMECGHVNNAVTFDGKPCCAICACDSIDREVHGREFLEDREAECPYCHKRTESAWNLPFFEYKPDQDHDEYYDGCFGWD